MAVLSVLQRSWCVVMRSSILDAVVSPTLGASMGYESVCAELGMYPQFVVMTAHFHLALVALCFCRASGQQVSAAAVGFAAAAGASWIQVLEACLVVWVLIGE
jgi:hypothetical protein